MTDHHIFRHEIASHAKNLLNNDLDLYGTGYHPVDYKLEALKDYQFSIVMENCCVDNYWSEKIIDCFKTGTIPIYYGPDSIGRTFNTDGIIPFKTKEQLELILNELCIMRNGYVEERPHLQAAIADNFKKADKYLVQEDLIWEKVLVPNGLA
jgi:hypothetical protein